MLIYILSAGLGLCGCIILYSIFRITQLRTQLQFTELESKKYSELYEATSSSTHAQELQIQELKHQLKQADEKLENFNELQGQAFTAAKSALFELGNDLSSKLISEHKRENQEVKKHSEAELNKNSQKFNEQFERIANLVSVLNKDITESKDTTDLIKRSLLSPSGAGSLAEITLENMLKNMSLRAGIDFNLQQEFTADDNNRLRPDAIIYLPHNNLMVIDAKASKFLVEMEQFDTTDKHSKATSAAFVRTMYNHLRSLSSKEYAHHVTKGLKEKSSPAHVITLMFLPSEGAIDKICALDSAFLEKAWSQNIYPVGPTGLMNMLSLAKFQITDELRSNNQQLIIDEVEKLIDSTSVLADHAAKMGNNLNGVLSNYDKFAASFNRNFLSKARNIQKLGVRGSKNKTDFTSLKRYMLVAASSDLLEVSDDSQQDITTLEHEKESK